MELYYREFGSGEPIIILHGLYGSSDNWMTIGKELSKKNKVYLIDQRNHGNSPHTSSHTYIDLKNDLDEFIKQKSLDKVTLIGHSMGGKAAMLYAANFPNKIKNLIIIDISPKDYTKLPKTIVQTSNHELFLKAMSKLDLNTLKSRNDADNQLSEYISNEKIRQFLLKNLKRNKNGIFSWKINLSVIISHLNDILLGISEQFKDISIFPVLFIKGEKSKYILEDDYMIIYNIFPKAEITTIPKAGHWMHVEQTDLLINTIYYFIDY